MHTFAAITILYCCFHSAIQGHPIKRSKTATFAPTTETPAREDPSEFFKIYVLEVFEQLLETCREVSFSWPNDEFASYLELQQGLLEQLRNRSSNGKQLEHLTQEHNRMQAKFEELADSENLEDMKEYLLQLIELESRIMALATAGQFQDSEFEDYNITSEQISRTEHLMTTISDAMNLKSHRHMQQLSELVQLLGIHRHSTDTNTTASLDRDSSVVKESDPNENLTIPKILQEAAQRAFDSYASASDPVKTKNPWMIFHITIRDAWFILNFVGRQKSILGETIMQFRQRFNALLKEIQRKQKLDPELLIYYNRLIQEIEEEALKHFLRNRRLPGTEEQQARLGKLEETVQQNRFRARQLQLWELLAAQAHSFSSNIPDSVKMVLNTTEVRNITSDVERFEQMQRTQRILKPLLDTLQQAITLLNEHKSAEDSLQPGLDYCFKLLEKEEEHVRHCFYTVNPKKLVKLSPRRLSRLRQLEAVVKYDMHELWQHAVEQKMLNYLLNDGTSPSSTTANPVNSGMEDTVAAILHDWSSESE